MERSYEPHAFIRDLSRALSKRWFARPRSRPKRKPSQTDTAHQNGLAVVGYAGESEPMAEPHFEQYALESPTSIPQDLQVLGERVIC